MLPFGKGNWPARLLLVVQVLAGSVALIALLATLTLNPFLLLGFVFLQFLLPVAAVLAVVLGILAMRAVIVEEFQPGETIYRQGRAASHVFVVKRGTVELLVKQPDGSTQKLAEFGEGDHFGSAAVFGGARRVGTARAKTECEIYRIRPSQFFALVDQPGLERLIAQGIELRVNPEKLSTGTEPTK
ncbi:MAG TPA: cyclic nucleotide-binding domain-containing protein [Candidatus Binataceae bacterium]|nr:cyclic nucleotide-binding domain-containing protein [Candidatus Binataceae bacterium]